MLPYLMSSHPGSTMKVAVELAEFCRDLGYNPEQVSDFYPTPSTISTCIYYTGLDPRTLGERRPRPVTAKVPLRGRHPPPRATGQKAQQDPRGSEARREDKEKVTEAKGSRGAPNTREWTTQSQKPRVPKGPPTPRECSQQSLRPREPRGTQHPDLAVTVTEAQGSPGAANTLRVPVTVTEAEGFPKGSQHPESGHNSH